MWIPDLQTLFITLILTDIVLTLILFLYWKNYRTYHGYLTWLLSLPVYCCSLILIMFRDILPLYLSAVLANLLFVFAFLMRLDAILKFVRSKPLDWKLYGAFLVLSLVIFSYCTYATDSVVLRGVFVAIVLLAIGSIGGIALLTSLEKETRTIRIALAVILEGIALLYVIRAIYAHEANTVFYTGAFTGVYYYCLILLEISATGLFVLLNMARYQAELIQSEKQIRENENRYRGVVTLANDGIVMIQDGVFKFLNPKAVLLYGGKEADLIDKPFLSFIHPRDQERVTDLYTRRMAGERVREVYETAIVSRDGDPVDVEFTTGIIDLDGKPTDLVFIRDIRERKRSEKALEQAKNKLGLLNNVTFNDIRTYVFTLSGYQTLVESNMKEPDEPVEPYLVKERELMQKIADSLKFAQAYQDLGFKPATWQEVGRVFLMAFSHLDTLKMGHTVTTGDLEIFADPLLEQVFQILAENVFTHGETATVISIHYLLEPDGSLTIFFEDNGVGIPADIKEKIFLPDFQTTKSAGLFLAREILEITDIVIRETGEPGKEARFEIRVTKGAYRFAAFLSGKV